MEMTDGSQFRLVHAMVTEIDADMEQGLVPRTVRSFSELHDHVDANLYGADFFFDTFSNRDVTAFSRDGQRDS